MEENYPNLRIIESDYIFWTKKQMKKFNLIFCVNCRLIWSIERIIQVGIERKKVKT